MAGLLTSQPQGAQGAAPAAGGAPDTNLQDPILQQVEDGIAQALPDNLRQGYNQIVNAGMAVMFSKETSNMMVEQLQSSDDMAANVSDGIAKLMVMLYNESKGQMQVEAAGPASITLMAMALDFAEKTMDFEVTPELVAEATKQTMTKTLEKFGITGDQLQQVMAAGQQAAGGAGGAGAPAPAQGGAQPQPMGV